MTRFLIRRFIRNPEDTADSGVRLAYGRLAGAAGLTPVLWDERRTTIEAHAILHAGGKKMKSHRKNVDAVAAALILEGYLTRKRMEPRE